MSVQTQAVKHFTCIGLLFLGVFITLQLMTFIPLEQKHPEFLLLLLWSPLVLSLVSFFLAIRWVFK